VQGGLPAAVASKSLTRHCERREAFLFYIIANILKNTYLIQRVFYVTFFACTKKVTKESAAQSIDRSFMRRFCCDFA
jgi:hypothetical protein